MKKILLVGGGGIGQRHLRCFLKTGRVEMSLVETDPEKLGRLQKDYPVQSAFSDFYKVPLENFDGAVIATPAPLHIPMATRCAKAGVPFLLEKPLSLNLKSVARLKEIVRRKRLAAGVAYVRRSILSSKKFRELALSGIIGQIRMARFNTSQEYPRYRPDYQKIYFAKEKMGGGCILDAASHMVNLAEWLLGKVTEVACFYDRLVLPKVECEDCCMMLMRFKKNRVLAEIFINQFQKPNVVELEMIGTKGNLRYDMQGRLHRITLCTDDTNRWHQLASFSYERDDFYVQQAEDFLAAISGKGRLPTSIEEAEATLRVCLAARKSQKTRKFLRP